MKTRTNYTSLLRWLSLLLCAAILFGGGRAVFAAQPSVTAVNAANYGHAVTADSIAAGFTSGPMTTVTTSAFVLPLPLQLGGVRVRIDNQFVPLFFVSPLQVNFHVPEWVTPGLHTLVVAGADGIPLQSRIFTGSIYVAENAPALYTFPGTNDAAAYYLSQGPLFAVLYGQGVGVRIAPDAIPGPGESVTLHLSDGRALDAIYAGPAPFFVGLQQFNVVLPPDLPPPGGAGISATLRVCVDNGNRCWSSNTVTLRR